MFIVGLTGGLATGKSTVLSIFREHGIAVIDADEVARKGNIKLLKPCDYYKPGMIKSERLFTDPGGPVFLSFHYYPRDRVEYYKIKLLEPSTKGWYELRDYFGEEVLLPDGKVNRARLGELVFDDIEKRRKLNAITHPRIQSAMMKMATAYFFSGHKYIVMEVPLLFETGKMLTFMHKIITVVCDDHQQLERLCKRSDFSEIVAKKRINTQMPLEEKVAKSHFVIDNSGDLAGTRIQAESIIRTLKRSKFTWYFRAIFLILLLSAAFGLGHIISNLFESSQ